MADSTGAETLETRDIEEIGPGGSIRAEKGETIYVGTEPEAAAPKNPTGGERYIRMVGFPPGEVPRKALAFRIEGSGVSALALSASSEFAYYRPQGGGKEWKESSLVATGDNKFTFIGQALNIHLITPRHGRVIFEELTEERAADGKIESITLDVNYRER